MGVLFGMLVKMCMGGMLLILFVVVSISGMVVECKVMCG